MGEIKVKYNNTQITPTPTVSRSLKFVDFGNRWGQVEEIELNCSITGLTTYNQALKRVTDMFSGQFKTLEVLEDSSTVYSWPNVVVQEISVPKSFFPVGGFVPYTTRLISYQVPSGVIDPVNEYSYSQNDDGTVTVNHKISARGIKNSQGGLDNAINFVKLFVKKNPFADCAPAFIPNTTTGVLMSVTENINRAECTYSVDEVYKTTTGANTSYFETHTLTIDESKNNDYVILDLNIKFQGSPVNKNLADVQTAVKAKTLTNYLKNNYGIDTNKIFQNSFVINQDSGSASIDLTATFFSGATQDFSGFFDYVVSMDKDLITNHVNWKIDGEFNCKGPLSFRKTRLDSFKSSNQAGGYIPYLYSILISNVLVDRFSQFTPNPVPVQLSISENTGLATLGISATFGDFDSYNSLYRPSYIVEVEPSRWIYEMLPSANIEGHYVLQDLQMRNQAKIKLSVESQVTGSLSSALADSKAVLATLSGLYINPSTGFLINENLSSGHSNITMEQDVLGVDKMAGSLLNAKVHGSVVNGYVRPANFLFGY